MKKRMVNILTWLCTFAFVCSAGSAVYFAKAEETEATEQPALVMQEGASIRYFDPVGIRFVTEITKEKYTEIKTADENAVFGTLILPYDLLNGQTLTLENYEALKANNIVAEEWLKDAETTKSFTGVLVGKDNGDGTYANFPEKYYNRDLYAVSYCSYNDKVIYAPNPQTYSVAYIASSLLAKGEKEELLYKITDSVLNDGISFKETAKEMTVGETFELNALLNAEGLKAVYTSENPEIACVDENGVITAVANGFVKITATIGNKTASVNMTVGAKDAGVMPLNELRNLDATMENDAEKGMVLKLSAKETLHDAAVLFLNNSDVKDYDYILFDIKASANVFVSITKNGTGNHGGFWTSTGTEWKTVSFAISAGGMAGDTWYYNPNDGKDDSVFGLYFFAGFDPAATVSANTTFEIKNIRLEKGVARFTDKNHNRDFGAYTFPKTIEDSRHNFMEDVWSGTTQLPVAVKKVTDARGNELSGVSDTVTFSVAGTYTVYYTVGKSVDVYTYAVTVSDPISDETLYYTGNENYTLPVKSVGGKAVTVTSITYGDGQTVECVGGSFLLTSGTPETANDTYKYVYTVNYTLAGDEATYSYTVTYYKPESINGRPVYLDTSYGLNHQLTVENASAKHSASAFTQVSDGQKLFGDGSVELTVQEDGVVWLHFDNVIWDSSYLSLRIAFSTSSVLRYGIYDAKGNKVGEDHTAFVAESEAERWSFAANGGNDDNGFVSVGNNDMSSFSIKLFSAYDNNGVLAAGTKILVAGLTAHPW